MPTVTVLLSSYNHERYLPISIESILNQTFTDYELIIVDDCSSDNSWNIICAYAKKDSRIKPIRHEYNWGGIGMKFLLPKTQGKYIAVAHCDDMWSSDKLEKEVAVLEQKDVAACFTYVNVIDDFGKNIDSMKHHYYNVFEQPNRTRFEWLRYFFYHGNCLCHPSLLIRKEAYFKYELLPSGLHGYPDFCQWIRLCKCAEIYIIPEKLTSFRVHVDESNTSGWNQGNLNRVYTEEFLILEEFLEICEKKEILKVFPEAEKYVINNEILEEFALAKIMLDSPKNSYKLKGFEILYQLFQKQETEEKMKELYDYEARDFNHDKQKYDIFSMIDKDQQMNCTIFWADEDEEYRNEQKITKDIFLRESGEFCVRVDFTASSKSNKVRVDLDERKYRRFEKIKFLLNGKEIESKTLNGKRNGEIDTFYTMDPQYELLLSQSGCLEITGTAVKIPDSEVEQYFSNLQNQYQILLKRKNESGLKRFIKARIKTWQ